ncbi:hypothetical protein PRK78_003256 [Emydomyces testavorans]|uniref:Vps72/YL1 C-terminal domain-containing protein n=1 Tax=Emydomyces testavorans TaxID=2070801 RepID=A0AAF0DFQ3_9EURO|nr:hypothetical protein PRK78_003256 [Emydomyces testavorans]
MANSSAPNAIASSSDDEPMEYLVTARAKRSTAGKHMGTLLDAEADDELALLFAEDEEDDEFTFGEEEEGAEGAAVEDAEDMELESSSDEGDEGPGAQEDELEGEKELEKQAKAERLVKKRKAHESLRLTALRKKVKIDTNLPSRRFTTPTPRPRKKSERISWLPTSEDGPTRSSSRRQTVRNKELTHARLKDSEQKRIRLIATMEEAAKRKENMKAKQMTQEDRLAEAEKTERINSKSLTRWEEMEKQRSEEQRAKLEALQNRRLEGPVITWWSGIAKWINDRLAQVGVKSYNRAAEKEASRKKRSKDSANQEVATGRGFKPSEQSKDSVAVKQPQPGLAAGTIQHTTKEEAPNGQPKDTPDAGASFLDGIHLYASMTDETTSAPAGQPSNAQPTKRCSDEGRTAQSTPDQSAVTQQSRETATLSAQQRALDSPAQDHSKLTSSGQRPPSVTSTDNVKDPSFQDVPVKDSTSTQCHPRSPPHPYANHQSTELTGSLPTAPNLSVPPPQAPPKIEVSSRNCIILEDFDATTPQERSEYSILFNSRKPQKLQKPTQEYCPITGRPARYRDPQTGLFYANAQAYREIRQVLAGRYAWSGFLGCFVGELGGGAWGVPERFLAPNAAPPQEFLVPSAEAESGPGSSNSPVANSPVPVAPAVSTTSGPSN